MRRRKRGRDKREEIASWLGSWWLLVQLDDVGREGMMEGRYREEARIFYW